MSRFFSLWLTMCGLLFQTTLMARAADPSPYPTKVTLPNGMRIICRQETDTPLVAIDVFVTTGVGPETAVTAGASNFVARTLLQGTFTHTPDTIQQEIGALGGNVGVSWRSDWTQINALTVSDRFSDAIFLLADVLKDATFDPDGIEKTRQQLLDEIDSRDADIFQTTYLGVRHSLYAGSPYGLPGQGTAYSIRHMRREDLLRYYDRYYVPSNYVIVIVGNIAPEVAIQKIKDNMSDFSRRSRGADAYPPPPALPVGDLPPVRAYQPGLQEACVMVGYRIPPVADADYPALLVANTLLGGMKSSRMFTNLREKQGLAYELGSVISSQRIAADIVGFAIAASTRADPVTRKATPVVGFVKDQILRQFASMKDAPPTPVELARAQHYLIGSYKIKHERIEDRAALLGAAEIGAKDGYKMDTNYEQYINAVTAADVQRVAQKYFADPAVSTVEPDAPNAGVVTAGAAIP